jgi:hypothetical protein
MIRLTMRTDGMDRALVCVRQGEGGAWQGALVGAGLCVVLGLVLSESLGSPNPDSAGGV